MRVIKFRGKRINEEKWIYGNLATYSFNFGSLNINKLVIFENITRFATDNFVFVVNDCEVAYDTVGQFTGLLDKNGKEIYEGDIVLVDDFTNVYSFPYIGEVVMRKGEWCVYYHNKYRDRICRPLFFDDFANKKTEVIGNIHDNPELLEGGEK